MSAHLRAAWASRITAAGETIWRGLNVKLPPDVEAQIDKLAEMPTEEHQIGQRFKIAPIVVSFLQGYQSHWDTDRSRGLGRHWTTRKSFAEAAAMQGNYGGTWIMLSATYDPAGVDHEHSYAGPDVTWQTEGEITLLPGAKVTITGVYVRRYGLDFNENLCKTPIRSVASKTAGMPGMFFRVVPTRLRDEVKTNGHRPSPSTVPNKWYPNGVYLWDSLYKAKDYKRFVQGREAQDIWALQLSEDQIGRLVPDPLIPESGAWVYPALLRPIKSRVLGPLDGVEAKTAAKFSPAQVATWEQTKPWNASRQDLEWQNIPGIYIGRARGSEAASFQDGKIVLKEDYFTLPEGGRRATLYHEAGHGLEEAVGLSGIGRYFGVDPLAVVTLPGAQRFGHNASEVVAEAYAVLWTEPQWAKGFEGGQAILGTVAKMARDNGYPLP